MKIVETLLKTAKPETVSLFDCFPVWVIVSSVRLMQRRSYYAKEKARRERLAAERKAVVVRRTTDPQPTLAAIHKIYFEFRRTHGHPVGVSPEIAASRLGSLLEDLERYVDNHILVDSGAFGCRGRAGGIKRLFEREDPDLFAHYKAIMRYKAHAKRYRQACGARDPVPVKYLLPAEASEKEKISVGGIDFPHRQYLRNSGDLTLWMDGHGNTDYLRTQAWAGRPKQIYSEDDILKQESLEIAAQILKASAGSFTALKKEISRRLDPQNIPHDISDVENPSAAS